MECPPGPTARRDPQIFTLTPAAPSLPGGPSAPGLPWAKGNKMPSDQPLPVSRSLPRPPLRSPGFSLSTWAPEPRLSRGAPSAFLPVHPGLSPSALLPPPSHHLPCAPCARASEPQPLPRPRSRGSRTRACVAGTETLRAPLPVRTSPGGPHHSPLARAPQQDQLGQEDPRGQGDLCLQMHQELPACQAHPEGTMTMMTVDSECPCPGPH